MRYSSIFGVPEAPAAYFAANVPASSCDFWLFRIDVKFDVASPEVPVTTVADALEARFTKSLRERVDDSCMAEVFISRLTL